MRRTTRGLDLLFALRLFECVISCFVSRSSPVVEPQQICSVGFIRPLYGEVEGAANSLALAILFIKVLSAVTRGPRAGLS